MNKEGRSAETALQKLHEQYTGYKRMEQQLTAKKVRLRVKIPDIEKTLGVVEGMKRAHVRRNHTTHPGVSPLTQPVVNRAGRRPGGGGGPL